MKTKFCESCSMPLENSGMLGTEKDGSTNSEYCIYCYKDGAFIKPDMTLSEMKELVQREMKRKDIDQALINMAVNNLPYLKRWGAKSVVL